MQLMEHVDSGRKQVEISVRIFEVADDFDMQVGMNSLLKHLGTSNSQALLGNFSPAAFVGRVVDPLSGIGPDPGGMLNLVGALKKAGIGIDVTLEALERSGMVKVVSQPRMTVEAGQPAYMMAGQELPIREGRLTNDKFVTEKITYKPVGVQLHITPQSIGEDSVKLHILTVVSAISGFAPLPSMKNNEIKGQLMNPVLDSRQAETRVEVPHGSTLAFGGLRMARQIGREGKDPDSRRCSRDWASLQEQAEAEDDDRSLLFRDAPSRQPVGPCAQGLTSRQIASPLLLRAMSFPPATAKGDQHLLGRILRRPVSVNPRSLNLPATRSPVSERRTKVSPTRAEEALVPGIFSRQWIFPLARSIRMSSASIRLSPNTPVMLLPVRTLFWKIMRMSWSR